MITYKISDRLAPDGIGETVKGHCVDIDAGDGGVITLAVRKKYGEYYAEHPRSGMTAGHWDLGKRLADAKVKLISRFAPGSRLHPQLVRIAASAPAINPEFER